MLVLSLSGVQASDQLAPEALGADMSATGEAVVTVTPIPSHAMVAELVSELNPSPEIRQSKRGAQKKHLSKSLLSRTERHQMALLESMPKSGEPGLFGILSDDDADTGADDLDLHRSFSRPKVAGQDEKGVGYDLSDAVKLRLFLARMQALRAYEKKFS
jgi:hypothetical protein